MHCYIINPSVGGGYSSLIVCVCVCVCVLLLISYRANGLLSVDAYIENGI